MDLEKLTDMYQNGDTLKSISIFFGVSVDVVRNRLKKLGIYTVKKQAKCKLPESEIISLYQNDHSIKSIAKQFHVSESPIVGILTKAGVRKPNKFKVLPYKVYEKILDKQYVQELVNNLITKQRISEELNCGLDMVTTILTEHNITLPSAAKQRSLRNRQQRGSIEVTKDNFINLHYEQGLPLMQINKIMGISPNYLRQLIRQWNLTPISNGDIRLSSEFKKFKNLPVDDIQRIIQTHTISDLAKDYKVSYDTLHKFLKVKNIQIPQRYRSSPEQELFDLIDTQYPGKVEYSNRSLIYPYELDIVIPDKKIAIEYCGLYWHSELNGKDDKYHLQKLQKCADKGYQLITIFDDEFRYKRDIVLSRLYMILGMNNPRKISARNCIVKEISWKEKKEFLDNNHLQGNDVSSIYYGLFDKCTNSLVSCMTFSQPSPIRSNVKSNDVWELNRFATSKNMVVRGGAGKLLSHFCKTVKWREIYSYADRRWSNGDMYYALGFELQGVSKPKYWYVPPGCQIREYRYKYAKFKLVEEGYDKNLTEKEIMESRGFTRIWDCGLLKFSIKNKE